jgi:DNA helicase II / ATP-dependent DNA helicase PcrA
MQCRVFHLQVYILLAVMLGLFQQRGLSGFSISTTRTTSATIARRTRRTTKPLGSGLGTSNNRHVAVQQMIVRRSFCSSLPVFPEHQHDDAGEASSFTTAAAAASSSTTTTSTPSASDRLKFEQSLLHDLNPSQIAAVTQPLASITRVIAGPGSGKTRVLTARIAYLLTNDRLHNILAVTFTKKAAAEMERRVHDLIGEQPSKRVSLGTFHSICTRILRFNGDKLRFLPSVVADMTGSANATLLDGGFSIMDQSDQVRLVKEVLESHGIDLKLYRDVKPLTVINVMGRLKTELSQGNNPFEAKDKRAMPDPPSLKIAKTIYFSFREKLLANNCLDFDDLIFLSRELLLHHVTVRDRLRSFWTHVLVDEFQDTSGSQMDLVKLLTSDSLLVVGDADQSIYSWRGAKATSLADFGNEYDAVDTVHLMENYRSTANIVKAAQMVIADSGQASGADKLRQQMIPKRGSGVAPRIVACANGEAEGKGSHHTAPLLSHTHAFVVL